MPTPVKDRVKAHYLRMIAKGLIPIRIWAYPADRVALKAIARQLRKRREG